MGFDKFCVESTSFTVKEEKADGSTEFAKTKLMTRLTYTLDAMSGDFKAGSDGSVNAVALPARSDADDLQKENNKNVAALKGSAVFNVAKYDETTGEIAGVFESIQPSDTDLGSKAPKDVKITGLWYAQLQK